ncbi:MAG: phenylalanine--tRNA ligase subunit beta [Planctomycetes bacterium]|nr:phenylalanine--tRNA ligase subunit beta [Planctomycetota bacterium]
MLVTHNWINDYLSDNLSAHEQAELLTAAGFPLEGTEELDSGDVRQDFEMTSNRGDCTCHVGLAREISARTGNTMTPPACDPPKETGCDISEVASVQNEESNLCPLYTARVIKNATVSESPEWLKRRIEDRGDVPRNAIVDATNFVLFELGQPTHVFDLDKVVGEKIIVRMATEGEKFLPLGEDAKEITLSAKDLVIADAEKPIALAGVKGGAVSAVTPETKNLLIESATFNPVTVRETSRRHNIASDSSFRFERGVSPHQIEPASNRLTNLLLELSGGELCNGTLSAGMDLPQPITVEMCTDFCAQKLGVDVSENEMVTGLQQLGFDASCSAGVLTCTVPYFRGDITREIDLVEEIGRVHGYENITIADSVEVRVPRSGGEADGRQAVLNALAGMEFVECVTHSLVSVDGATPFLMKGEAPLLLQDSRTAAEPVLRPSIIPSLLRVRKHNDDNGVKELRIAELGSVFKLVGDNHEEHLELALLIDAKEGDGIGEMRAILDRLCQILTATITVEVTPDETATWLEPSGTVSFNGKVVGKIGRLASSIQQQWDVPNTIHLAQLDLNELFAAYPPEVVSTPLPTQPSIERDVSAILREEVSWQQVNDAITSLDLPWLEAAQFVTVFRGKGIESGKKSLTFRLRFRDKTRTLTHEEVDAPSKKAIDALCTSLGAEIRS